MYEAPSLESLPPPVYHGATRVVDYGTKPLTGMTAKLQLMLVDQGKPHPFKGMRVGKSSGHRLRAVFSRPKEGGDLDEVLYDGEAMLTWWSEDCQNGMRVIVRLDDGPDGIEDRHPLKGIDPGQKSGGSVFAAFWAIADDETVQEPVVAKKASRPWTSLNATEQSNILCADARFQTWCRTVGWKTFSRGQTLPVIEGPGLAADLVRMWCGVTSRAHLRLDTPEGFAAREKWSAIMRSYEDWKRGYVF